MGKDEIRNVAGSRGSDIGKNDEFKIGKAFAVAAVDEIVLKTGDSSITMKKDGTIQIKGKDIIIKGSGKINVKADSDITVKGSKIEQN